ncbi:helix-turn-helix domain-containing protein [Streptomyces iconiensis]|uniref:Helix-turn-helix transcriptional regulator n=1 Tax=Streptomyces iconiensis TaxID=1384038 RepID=A0ABT7A2T6_9ACTN|nr:helix-turn-helix transcriptional regulator [Streptomyces iconiensis]MDJ1135663.1 helix-turn-helix transcriptional regulator [Streptomyces iconiensis]
MPHEEQEHSSASAPSPCEQGAQTAALHEIVRLLCDLLEITERMYSTAISTAERETPGPCGPHSPPPGRAPPVRLKTERLAPREVEVFELLLTGASNRHIARQLGIAERTVKNNLHSIYRKLGVSGRAEAIARSVATAQPEEDTNDS